MNNQYIPQDHKSGKPLATIIEEIMAEDEKKESVQDMISCLEYYHIGLEKYFILLRRKNIYVQYGPAMAKLEEEIDLLKEEYGGGL